MSEFPTDWTNYCGYTDPTELTQVVGMNPNTADYYGAGVEGQDIDITGLRAGNYVLINWVDSTCELNERSYADNAASTAFTLQYPQGPNGLPTLTLGAELNGVPHPPCPPPDMNGAEAAHYVQQAVVKRSGGPVTGLRFRCTRANATGFNCPASWRRGRSHTPAASPSASWPARSSLATPPTSPAFRTNPVPREGLRPRAAILGQAEPGDVALRRRVPLTGEDRRGSSVPGRHRPGAIRRERLRRAPG